MKDFGDIAKTYVPPGEIYRLRAELASAHAHQDATCCMLDEAQSDRDRLRAELAAIKERVACYWQPMAEAWQRDAAAKDASIAELEKDNSEIAIEALSDHRALHARAEKAEADCAAVIVDTARELGCFADNEGILAAIATLRDDCKRAEAEADSLRNTIDNMRAMNIKLTLEATGKVLAAEAERDALRVTLPALTPEQEAHLKTLEPQPYDPETMIRGSSPAGREG